MVDELVIAQYDPFVDEQDIPAIPYIGVTMRFMRFTCMSMILT